MSQKMTRKPKPARAAKAEAETGTLADAIERARDGGRVLFVVRNARNADAELQTALRSKPAPSSVKRYPRRLSYEIDGKVGAVEICGAEEAGRRLVGRDAVWSVLVAAEALAPLDGLPDVSAAIAEYRAKVGR